MVAGNPSARVNDPTSMTSLTCHGDPRFASLFCPDALHGYVAFQSCWNGNDLVKADNSHVAYPANGGCPSSHPVELPSMGLEVVYKVQIVPLDGGYYFFANGDTTGKLQVFPYQNIVLLATIVLRADLNKVIASSVLS